MRVNWFAFSLKKYNLYSCSLVNPARNIAPAIFAGRKALLNYGFL